MLTPLTDWIETIACAIRPSSRSDQETWEPSPGTRPQARTSKVPPRLSLSFRRRLISSTIAAEARRVQAAHRVVVDAVEVRRRRGRRSRRVDAGDPGHVAADRHPDRGEELARQRARGDPGGGLAGARALEHVASVVEAVLLEARQVGVAGPRQVDLLDALAALPRPHPLDPVLVVAVGDQQRDRAAERAAVADARADLGGVASRSSSARRGRGRAGGGPCRGRAPRGRARAPRACPRRSRSDRGRGIPPR